jgi:hypothetical protein
MDMQIANGDKRDAMTGTHALSAQTMQGSVMGNQWPLKSESVTIGCVPCFGPMTYVAVIGEQAFSTSGLSMAHSARLRVMIGGKAVQVADDLDPATFAKGKHRGDVYDLLNKATERLPGCNTAAYISNMAKLASAMSGGACLSDHKP